MSDLHLEAISHAFGDNQVLSGVSVNVAAGELVCLLGPSGCGKTTLLRLAAGLEPLQKGQIKINDVLVADGTNSNQMPPEQRGAGLMFQDFALFPHLNVRDNITFGIDAKNKTRRAEWLDHALTSMGLVGYADAYPHTLSGGQQQRVALVRALAPDPRILLLDEPFSGLDVTRRAQIRTETLRLVKQTGVATLMVTHDPEEAMFMADRILVMNEGRVVQDGTPVELYSSPKNAFVAEFFGPVNKIQSTVHNSKVETPVGVFDADGQKNGTQVDVLVRPEGFRLANADEKPHAMPGDNLGNTSVVLAVVNSRPLGRSSYVAFKLSTGQVIETRVPGLLLPAPGSNMSVSVNAHQVHVFASTIIIKAR